jgi:glutamate synthase (NADPH/NADH) small chain
MTTGKLPDIAAGRLRPEEYAANFSDLHPPLDRHQAIVEADRCYFCFDAPCVAACPTGIDVPMFIREILTGNPKSAAETIFSQNILGGMCARVCPTETLCEQACVRQEAEGNPVRIGALQRYATDVAMATNGHPFARRPSTGKRIAVVGGGPAGLACAHRLAIYGHDVVIYEARDKLGGLNEYGIAAYKVPDGFAGKEVDFILAVGGIAVETGKTLGRDIRLAELRQTFDAVFLGLGLAGVNALGLADEDTVHGVTAAVDYIAELRQAGDLAALPVGRRVVVVGGGMTAIDIAAQSKRLGAEDVTIVYRRGSDRMGASDFERELAQTDGVRIKFNAMPKRLVGSDGKLTAVEFEYTAEDGGRLVGTGETFALDADMAFKAIGQAFVPVALDGAAITLDGGRIAVDEERRTNLYDVWAGGDCVAGGEDLTVVAVEDGKIAAESIHRHLVG